MPIITIQFIKDIVANDEQKRELMEKMTDTFVSVVGDVVRPYTYCLIQETRAAGVVHRRQADARPSHISSALRPSPPRQGQRDHGRRDRGRGGREDSGSPEAIRPPRTSGASRDGSYGGAVRSLSWANMTAARNLVTGRTRHDRWGAYVHRRRAEGDGRHPSLVRRGVDQGQRRGCRRVDPSQLQGPWCRRPGRRTRHRGPQGVDPAWRTGFPDAVQRVDDIFAVGDKVCVRLTWVGTHSGEFMGVPPTGKAVSVGTIGIDRVVDGKVVEGWGELDMLGLMTTIGVSCPRRRPEAVSGPETRLGAPHRAARIGSHVHRGRCAMSVEESKALYRHFVEEVINNGKFDEIPGLYTEDYVDHSAPPGAPAGSRRRPGRTSRCSARRSPMSTSSSTTWSARTTWSPPG